MTAAITSSDALLTDLEFARALYDSGAFTESADASRMVYETTDNPELKFRAILLWSSSESEQRRYKTALKVLRLIDPLLDDAKPRWKANYFCQRAYLDVKLNPEVVDAGVIDYSTAILFAGEADDLVVESRARNNLARRYSKADRFDEALVEVDKAIGIADRLGEQVELGRYHDQRAQILIDHGRHEEALRHSQKALRLLVDHPALTEARTTHGRALIALGSQYLEQEDPIDTFTGKREAEKYVSVTLDAKLLRLALDRADGNILYASEILHVKHPSLLEAVKRFKLARSPVRRRGKSFKQK